MKLYKWWDMGKWVVITGKEMLKQMFGGASRICGKSPSATKSGPGRLHLSGYFKFTSMRGKTSRERAERALMQLGVGV